MAYTVRVSVCAYDVYLQNKAIYYSKRLKNANFAAEITPVGVAISLNLKKNSK